MKHGHTRVGWKSRTYTTWDSMIQRCTNPRNLKYPKYGAVGIAVCERWLTFDNFLSDMGERPPGKSLDRFPNRSGNYEPSNCRWATPHEQQVNRDATRLNDDLVQEIRGRREYGQSIRSIASFMNLTHGSVADVACGRKWKET